MTFELVPSATYSSPDIPELIIKPDISHGNHTTLGKTTGLSSHLVNVTKDDLNFTDKDIPSPHNKESKLGQLRAVLTTLQDDINTFLTERMNKDSTETTDKDRDLERRILDEGVDEEDKD
ncbi:hypothetical protein PACTADRAFT_50363 [Pachysolen tannophilus NRRL Y-2460]|uniref:EKC/KEOPS complex subunit GON7 n=1 Tax=Pachysolen tannophilus NRRL Y-2460 TaxID=669874 RepID=A0A1E4TV99_PACTA|nr:hypothetical protein PACTADRAFT_50363 [Pachysolen tannophilus NRRL Y-2460]